MSCPPGLERHTDGGSPYASGARRRSLRTRWSRVVVRGDELRDPTNERGESAPSDGHGRLELTRFRSPAAVSAEPKNPPANTLGLRSVMFAVDDIEDVIARLRAHGAELVGEVARYEDSYRLCYVRGPAGIIVALAEQLS